MSNATNKKSSPITINWEDNLPPRNENTPSDFDPRREDETSSPLYDAMMDHRREMEG